jgi:hypothetical protein
MHAQLTMTRWDAPCGLAVTRTGYQQTGIIRMISGDQFIAQAIHPEEATASE